MAQGSRSTGYGLAVVAVLLVLHAAFSTFEYLSTLKALGRHASASNVPVSIVVEALLGLTAFLLGTTLASAPLQDITYRGELAKRSLSELDSRLGFARLSARSRAFFGDHGSGL